jgi:RNA polymerase sigma-70 factor (ECF subfamily)
MTDEDLVLAYRGGEESAFSDIVGRYIGRIYSFTYRLSGDQSMAEDATQETFVKVWKGIRGFDETKRFKSWIFAIARNSLLDIARKRRDKPLSRLESEGEDIAASIVDMAPLQDEVFDGLIDSMILEKTLGVLSPGIRSVVILHDLEGLTFEEISSIMKKPMNTIKSSYRRALMKLRETMHQKELE